VISVDGDNDGTERQGNKSDVEAHFRPPRDRDQVAVGSLLSDDVAEIIPGYEPRSPPTGVQHVFAVEPYCVLRSRWRISQAARADIVNLSWACST
jgi:hypothetical protein